MRALLLASVLAAPASAQTVQTAVTAMPVLEVPAVPVMGGATVGRSADDARAFLQNPAALALAPAGQSVSDSPSAAWFGESRVETAALAWTRETPRLRWGVGVAQGAMSGDARTLADGTRFDPTDRYRALGASVGTRGAVRVALGASARYVTTTDAPVYDGAAFSVGRLRGVAADVGALASADVMRLAGSPRVGVVAPTLDVSVGYAQTSIGGAVRYSGFARQALPRTGALGWSARAGLDARVGGQPLRLVETEAAFQAERVLARDDADGVAFDRMTGGLGLASALAGSGSARTTGRRGLGVTIAETLAITAGQFEGGGYRLARTRSVEVRTGGLFRLAARRVAPGPVAAALGRVDLRVARTAVWAGSPDATAQTTFSLVVRR